MSEALARQLAELESASTAELRARWERAESGLSKAALKRLAHLADPKGNDGRPAPPRLRPGTRLIGEWRGAVHQVGGPARAGSPLFQLFLWR